MHPRIGGRLTSWRPLTLLAGLFVSFALALTLAPSAQAAPAPPKAVGGPVHPTASQLAEAKIAGKVLDTRPKHKGLTLDYRRALKAAGRKHKVVAQDVALGMLKGKGHVTHISSAERKALKARAKKLGQSGLVTQTPARSMALAAPDPCPGSNSLHSYWWGYRANLDQCRTTKVIHSLETVAFVAGLLSTFFKLDPRSTAIMAIAVAIVGIGVFALNVCARPKRGVKIYFASTFGPADIWCRSQ